MRKDHQFSYRNDKNVPDFDDSYLFTVMDAHCGLCSKGAKWIARNDKHEQFKIIPMQSDLGQALFQHYAIDPNDPASWLYVENGYPFTSLDATIQVGSRLGGVWHGLKILNLVPKFMRDKLYAMVARNRYRFFGRTDLCEMLDSEVQKRLLR